MNDLIAVEKIAQWQKLKALVLDSVSSPITKRVYNMALNEFMAWFQQAPRAGFTKATGYARWLHHVCRDDQLRPSWLGFRPHRLPLRIRQGRSPATENAGRTYWFGSPELRIETRVNQVSKAPRRRSTDSQYKTWIRRTKRQFLGKHCRQNGPKPAVILMGGPSSTVDVTSQSGIYRSDFSSIVPKKCVVSHLALIKFGK